MARLEDKFKDRALRATKATPAPASDFNPLAPARATLTDIPLDQIETDPNQPRQDLGDLTDLKASIASVGLVQPVIVTILGYERYRLVAGERRFTAAKELDLPKIAAIVRTVEEHQRLELQIVENLHRKDLNPFEEAQSYKRLMEEFGLNQEAAGKRLGKSQVSISELLRLLDLPETIRDEYRTSDKISKSVLLEIAKRPASEQLSLWEQAKQGLLTVRKARSPKNPRNKQGSAGSPSATTFPHHIQTRKAVVTVSCRQRNVSTQVIIAALEEALSIEKARHGTA